MAAKIIYTCTLVMIDNECGRDVKTTVHSSQEGLIQRLELLRKLYYPGIRVYGDTKDENGNHHPFIGTQDSCMKYRRNKKYKPMNRSIIVETESHVVPV